MIAFALAVVSAVALAALSAWVVALLMPRGPGTALQGGAVMRSCVTVGVIAGAATRSRWAPVLLPVVHIAILEILRLSLPGP
jgi:hypothetical protein